MGSNQFSLNDGQPTSCCLQDIAVVGGVQFTAEASGPSRLIAERPEERCGAFGDRQVCLVPKVWNG